MSRSMSGRARSLPSLHCGDDSTDGADADDDERQPTATAHRRPSATRDALRRARPRRRRTADGDDRTATSIPAPTASADADRTGDAPRADRRPPTLSPTAAPTSSLRVGVAAVKLSPCGANPDYDGPITPSGVWGETFTDMDGNGRWDDGEPFVDDPVNTALDPRSEREVRRHLSRRLRQRPHRRRLP